MLGRTDGQTNRRTNHTNGTDQTDQPDETTRTGYIYGRKTRTDGQKDGPTNGRTG